jgi:hypothetical protein
MVCASCERITVRLLRCFRHHAAREVETRWIVCVNVIEPNKQHLLGILGPSQQSSGVCAVALGFADVPLSCRVNKPSRAARPMLWKNGMKWHAQASSAPVRIPTTLSRGF